MKVTNVTARCLGVPIKFPFTETPRVEGMLVCQVETDEGITGHGISRDQERFAVRELINREIGPFLAGKDPMSTEQIWNEASWELGQSYRVRDGVVARACGAVDQALWDIKGKCLNQPIYRLLGGASQDSVACYTTFGFNVYNLEQLVELAVLKVREGHDKLKMQVVAKDRGQDVSADVARVKAVREAVGDKVMLMVDGNSKMDFTHARELARRMEPYNITWFDDPVYIKDIHLMAELRKHTTVPLAARAHGENVWDNRDMIMGGAVDVMQANVLDGGGYTQYLKVAHMAELFHLPLANGGGWYLQNMHLIAGVANGWLTEFHLLREQIYDKVYHRPPVAHNGQLHLGDRPGLGLELNQAAVEEYTEP
ncbi:MAG: mandelate racemase/muconate lactonizing enzyme family protein [SAR202 cluster bacterium]|nr:mandelate racemase/muconate lactonizing enzyme family protein [SAR202 cluster bacterium]